MTNSKTAGIILNGVRLTTPVQADYIICADGGYNLYNGTPNAIIGDLDSIVKVPDTANIIKYPARKNFTDGELAVRYAVEQGYNNINIYAGLHGRIDHVMGNMTLLQVADSLGAKATIVDEDCTINYCTIGTHILNAKKGATLSILPINGAVTVSSSAGLEYPLNNLTLTPPTTMGLSNVAYEDNPTITITAGAVLIVAY